MINLRLITQIRASYSAKLIAIFIVALCLMASALNITSNRMHKTSYTDYMRTSGLAMAQLLAKSVQLDVFSENIAQLAIPVESLLYQKDIIQVEILDSEGETIISRRKSTDVVLPERREMQTLINSNAGYFKEWPTSFSYWWPVEALATTSSEDDLYFGELAEMATGNEVPLGYITIIVSKMQYEKNIRDMAFRTGLTILILLVLLVTGVLLLLRRLTQPLRNLINKIQDQGPTHASHDDIGLLDTTVTTLINDLDHSFQTINDLKDSLEDKVAQRTRQLAQANEELTTRQEYLEEANQKLEKAMQELQETEGQLIQSEKMAAIGQVVAGVAHEINNNINFISGALPSLDRGMEDVRRLTQKLNTACTNPTAENLEEAKALQVELEDEELFDDLNLLMDNIHEGVNRTTMIIADLRTFSRADEQGYKAVDLHKSIDSTITFLKKEHLDNIEIKKEYADIPRVYCHPDRINQVFLNIMNNALHAMAGQGGILSITTFVEDSHVHICFADTGVGISKEVLPKIFDPFFTSRDIGEGSGIGLAISYKIIEQHEGRIEVTSEEGKGSSFEVILPLDRQDHNQNGLEMTTDKRQKSP